MKCGAIEMPFEMLHTTWKLFEVGLVTPYVTATTQASSIGRGAHSLVCMSDLRDQYRKKWETYVGLQSTAANLVAQALEFGYTSATDPRDRIFALVGLVDSAKIPRFLMPNYAHAQLRPS